MQYVNCQNVNSQNTKHGTSKNWFMVSAFVFLSRLCIWSPQIDVKLCLWYEMVSEVVIEMSINTLSRVSDYIAALKLDVVNRSVVRPL